MLRSAKNFLLDLVFPPLCLTCEEPCKDKVCQKCLASVELANYMHCPVCMAKRERRCHPEARYLLAAATDYENPVLKKMIWQFKYEGWQSLAHPLANLVVSYFEKNKDYFAQDNWLITPVPLHRRREKERGFNQAKLLAELLSWRVSKPWSEDNLIRVKETETQADFDGFGEREVNVKDAFFINNPEKFEGKNIILVDDVHTSGATVNECARLLKLAGAKKVVALVVARA